MSKTKKPTTKSRLDLVREGLDTGISATGRKVVSIDKVSEDPANERKTFKNIEGLAASVKQLGIVEPPTVFEVSKDRYQIITGHRRFRAAKMAKLPKLEVVIRKPDEDHTTRVKSIVSNVQREDVNPIEMANALQGLLDDNNGIDEQQQLAEMIGKNKSWVSKMLKILTLPAELQAKVATSQLTLSYDAMAEIARLKEPKDQEELVDQMLSGSSVREIRSGISKAKGGKPAASKAGSTGADSEGKKPKFKYSTKQGVAVILQATEAVPMTKEQKVKALQEALRIAKKEAD